MKLRILITSLFACTVLACGGEEFDETQLGESEESLFGFGGVAIENEKWGECLAVNSQFANSTVFMSSCTNHARKTWRVEPQSNGRQHIVNVWSGLCLTRVDRDLVQQPCSTFGARNSWLYNGGPFSSGHIYEMDEFDPGNRSCIRGNNNNPTDELYIAYCASTRSRRWYMR